MDFAQNALGLSHKFIYEHVSPGNVCIDATAGRGRDTLFLCELVGESGKVFAFDIQEEAINSTRELLNANKKSATLFLECHSKMDLHFEKNSIDADEYYDMQKKCEVSEGVPVIQEIRRLLDAVQNEGDKA